MMKYRIFDHEAREAHEAGQFANRCFFFVCFVSFVVQDLLFPHG